MFCLGCWTAPIAAFILAAGWSASGANAFQLATPDAGAWRAFRSGALPAMRPWIVVAAAASALIALTEFSVCHICLVRVWNTFVLEQVEATRYGQLLLAWPLVITLGVLLPILWLARGRLREMLRDLSDLLDQEPGRAVGMSRAPLLPAIGSAIVLLLPWFLLIWSPPARLGAGQFVAVLPGTLVGRTADQCRQHACRADPRDGALISFCQRHARCAGRAFARPLVMIVVACAALVALLPPSLVGDLFLAAYANVGPIYDYWYIVSFVTAARFAVIALVIGMFAARVTSAAVTELARTERLSWAQTYFVVRFPLAARGMFAGVIVVGLLSLTEVAASKLVQPPGTQSLALTLLNEIHGGRRDEVIALCLQLMVFVGLVIALLPRATALLGYLLKLSVRRVMSSPTSLPPT